MKHLVISRLAINGINVSTTGIWSEWLENSISLMDKFCRPSLKNQSNQNFTLLSIVDNSVFDVGNKLDNEVIIKINPSHNKYPRTEIIDGINNYIRESGCDSCIITRLDRDDCMRYDFVNNIQKHFYDRKEKYIDIRNCHNYDVKTKKIYEMKLYKNNFVSPFVSTYEKVKDNKIECIPYKYNHPNISKYMTGNKVDDLYSLQVIHGNNFSNKINGINVSNINLEDYGI